MNKKSKTRERGHPVRIRALPRPLDPTGFVIAVSFFLFFCSVTANSQIRHRPAPTSTSASLVITSEPNAIIWLDEIRRGVTDATGKLALAKVSAGRHVVRVRANGFSEVSLPPLSRWRGTVVVRLARTNDEAELSFQQAEEAREKAKDDESRKQAVGLYHRALKL